MNVELLTAEHPYREALQPGMFVSLSIRCPETRTVRPDGRPDSWTHCQEVVRDLVEITSVTATGFRGERCCFPWSLPREQFRIGQPIEFHRHNVFSVESPERAREFIRYQRSVWQRLRAI